MQFASGFVVRGSEYEDSKLSVRLQSPNNAGGPRDVKTSECGQRRLYYSKSCIQASHAALNGRRASGRRVGEAASRRMRQCQSRRGQQSARQRRQMCDC